MGKAELAAELRAMRKQHVKPISKMRSKDISQEIEGLKLRLAETPPVASLPSAPHKAEVAAVESVKVAKAAEFPVKPASESKAAPHGEKKAVGRPKKMAELMSAKKAPAAGSKKKAMMAKLLAALQDSDDE